MFKIFPATLSPDGQKVPIISGWQENATLDQNVIAQWQHTFGDKIKFWGVPCGTANNILVLDVDTKDVMKNGFNTLQAEGLVVPNTYSQDTPSGGRHYFFKYPNDGRKYSNRVGFKPGLDVRSEGGWVAWYGVNVNNAPIADAPEWLLTEILKEKKVETNAQTFGVAPEIAKGILDAALDSIRHAPPGQSNDTLNAKAFEVGRLVASGSFTREYVELELFKAAKDRGKPDYEAKATIKSGLDGGISNPLTVPFGEPNTSLVPAVPQNERWTPSYLTLHDLKNTSKLKKPQLFKDWSTEDIHITTADGGTGKTTLKLLEAICLALGERFLGFENVRKGKTLFITGEDTDKKLAAMLGAIMRQMGLFEEGLGNEEKVKTILESIVIKKDADLCLITKDRQGWLVPSVDAFNKVMQAVEDIKPDMIVFDPIASFWGSEAALNDMSKAVAKFMSKLQEASGACVEMINHMGKSSSQSKDMTQFAGRGGSALPSHARVSRVMRLVDENEFRELTGRDLSDNESAIMCQVNKFTDGSPLFNKPFLIVRNGYLFSRMTLNKQIEKKLEEQIPDTERVFRAIKDFRRENKFPSKQALTALFNGQLSKDRVTNAVNLLSITGYLGEFVKIIDNPDVVAGGKVLTIVDENGVEL